jgi:sulfite reductase (NADPH) flavoprotein alpha-component
VAKRTACFWRRKRSGSFLSRIYPSPLRWHFWLGTAVVPYILFVSLSGCIILFEQDLYRFFSPDPEMTTSDGQRLSADELIDAALLRYPGDRVVGVWDRKVSADVVAELWLEGPGGMRRRLFHPYTGSDLGNAEPLSLRTLAFLRDAHMNLLAGHRGRIINGVGAFSMVLLSLSGALLWSGRLKRARQHSELPATSLTQRARKFHRRAGAWMIVFAILSGATGACFAFPSLVHGLVGSASGGEAVFDWLYTIHSGSAGGWFTKAIWAASGLLTSLLAVTGAVRWHGRAARTVAHA